MVDDEHTNYCIVCGRRLFRPLFGPEIREGSWALLRFVPALKAHAHGYCVNRFLGYAGQTGRAGDTDIDYYPLTFIMFGPDVPLTVIHDKGTPWNNRGETK